MKTLKTSEIYKCDWNTREEITTESVEDLATSILSQGLINPITIWFDADGDPVCIAGNRRLAALVHNGVDEIEEGTDFTIFTGTESEARIVTVTENLQREEASVIEEARAVAECTDAGMKDAEIASRCGRPLSWVRRRRKLLDLDTAFVDHASQFRPNELEMIAAYPKEVQSRVAKFAKNANVKSWESLKCLFEREMRDLANAAFDTSPCKLCQNRTGCDADLFGYGDEGLGRCLDAKCYETHRKAFIDAEVKRLTKGADEVVRVQYSWMAPSDSQDKRDKAHPCAYVTDCGDSVVVRWGASKKAIDAAKAAKDEEREAEVAKNREIRERAAKITEKLDGSFNFEEGRWPDALIGHITKFFATQLLDENMEEWLVGAIADAFCAYHSNAEWATILATFDFAAEIGGLSKDEVDFMIEKFSSEDDED